MSWQRRQALIDCYGRTPEQLVGVLMRTGLEQRMVGLLIGIAPAHVRRVAKKLDPAFRWPAPRIRLENLQRQVERVTVRTPYRGADRTLREIADLEGLPLCTVQKRYAYGLRGDALGKRRRHSGRRRECYELGISVREWREVLRYAQERGDDAARLLFGVPRGAISAARRGEWERLA